MRRYICLLPLVSLILSFSHDRILERYFSEHLASYVHIIETNFDHELSGGTNLPKEVRYISCDDRKTPFVIEYRICLLYPYALKDGYPTKSLSYYRNQ